MYEVTVEAGFSSGHYLREYRGKCENPHGHNYKMRLTLAGEELDGNGLLVDFKDIKRAIQPALEYLDHQMINDLPYFREVNPSAENLARYLFDECAKRVVVITENRVTVKSCTLFETDTSFATYLA